MAAHALRITDRKNQRNVLHDVLDVLHDEPLDYCIHMNIFVKLSRKFCSRVINEAHCFHAIFMLLVILLSMEVPFDPWQG